MNFSITTRQWFIWTNRNPTLKFEVPFQLRALTFSSFIIFNPTIQVWLVWFNLRANVFFFCEENEKEKWIFFFFIEFVGNVLVQNGQIYDSKLSLTHCPGNAGCRSVIEQSDGNNQFLLNENFVLSLQVRWNRFTLLKFTWWKCLHTLNFFFT